MNLEFANRLRQDFPQFIFEESDDFYWSKKENPIFTVEDLVENGLCIGKGSKEKRLMLGDMLNIGYYNSKQLLNALNSFNITRSEFEEAMKSIKEK